MALEIDLKGDRLCNIYMMERKKRQAILWKVIWLDGGRAGK